MKEINTKDLKENVFDLIGNRWCLISAIKNDQSINTMTASWGGLGVLWGKDVATIYIRPQRYTKEFVDEADYFTLSFFDEKDRDILKYCGKTSGRDIDKIEHCHLTVIKDKSVYFKEAKLVLLCKKLYVGEIKKEHFVDQDIIKRHYPTNDFHHVYIGEIEKVIENY